MHGYGYPPELPPARPSSAALTVLRVVFVALTVLSCGFLGWAATLRLAIVTRRPRDWVLFVLTAGLTVALFAYLVAIPEEQAELTDTQGVIMLGGIFALMGGVTWYYLYQDIRHFGPYGPVAAAARAQAAGYPPAVPVQGYGYPPLQQTPPYGAPPVPHHPQGPTTPYPSVQHQPVQPPPPPQQSNPVPPPKRPGPPQRLDQVRAELDELSDYLRKENEGR
ncbi:hypothetical protein [Streptomyces sp. NBC_00102]|uniref:hypothetical protein n=1 Tax=Streptomyces sp. NBC_00102 TaxID=2975652 RepID=UPI00224DF171|nr:hypothetical protein [Streptomyces sp. NBC_00102]MCX5399154.1 hypothetical protein [Streptomyces sp. NBC_00102]